MPPPTSTEKPFASSSGTVVVVSQAEDKAPTASATSGYRQFSGAALTGLREKDDSGKRLLEKGEAAEAHADGLIAWGRWTGGKNKIKDNSGSGDVQALHYFTFAGTPTLPVLKSFTSFGATATTVTSAKGELLSKGAENAASGTLRVTFPGPLGGFSTYALSVPVAGQTFSVAGSALQSNTYGFAGTASISSDGSGCSAGCRGVLANGNTVQGMVGGTGSGRAGLVYGFSSSLGNVTGAMVFKP